MTTKLNAMKSNGQGQIDRGLLLATMLLACFGLIMVLSSSGVMAERNFGDTYYFFKRQFIYFTAGVLTMYGITRMSEKILFGFKYFWLIVIAILLGLCASPLGVKVGGASRWLHLGPVNIQPMEFAKPALVIYLAYFFGKKQDLVKSFSVGFLPPFIVTGALCLLLLLQPDFGGAVYLTCILFLMCAVGGTRIIYLLFSFLIASGAGWLLITSSEYRFKRWTAFLDPFASPLGDGYQIVQSLYAFGNGGATGTGMGAGKQKLFFLPEAHNDFIMAVAGEELGFIGMSLFFIMLGFFLFRAFKVVMEQEDLQNRFTAFGMTCVLALGFVLNLAVVLGTVPPKGVAMPFISYGGSNLLASFICAGVLLRISKEGGKQ